MSPDSSEVNQRSRALALMQTPHRRDEAFELMFRSTEKLLSAYLAKLDRNPATRESHADFIAEVFHKIWQKREELHFESEASWLAYCKTSVDRALFAHSKLRKSTGDLDPAIMEVVADASSTSFIDRLELTTRYQNLMDHADQAWLGELPSKPKGLLLAAKLILIDGYRASVAILALQDFSQIRHTTFRELLDLIAKGPVLSRVFYTKFHQSPQQLIDAAFSGIPEPCDLYRRVAYFRLGSLLSDHSVRSRIEAPPEELNECLKLIKKKLPFLNALQSFKSSIEHHQLDMGLASHEGFWKRVVFQYHLYGLSQRDIVEWFGDAAQLCRCEVSDRKMNLWFGKNQLVSELQRKVFEARRA